MQHRLGIIGAGRVAQEHAKAARAVGAEIIAVCDQDLSKAERFIKEFAPDARAHDSLEAFLDGTDMRGVVIAVPNVSHKDVALRVIEAGFDVLLEKPMAMNLAECDQVIAARDQSERAIQMGFVCRGAPRVRAVRDLLDSGALGRIYHAKATLLRKRGIPGLGRWFTTRQQSGGGVLIDIGVHLIDLVMHLTDRTVARRASAVCQSRFGSPIEKYIYEDMWAGPPDPTGVFDVEDAATALLRFDDELSMELNVCWAANLPDHLYRDGVLLLGDKGGCFFDLWTDQFIITREANGRVIDERPDFDNSDAWDRAWQWQHERFAELVTQHTPSIAPAEAGRAVQAIVEAMYQSSAENREVDIASPRSTLHSLEQTPVTRQ